MKQLQKLLSFVFLVTLILQGTLGFTAPASALFGVSIPSPSQIADQMEKRYNIDPEVLRDQGQKFNVVGNKQLAPQIGSVVFSPSDPRVGQRITAKAFPLYFNGSQEQFYYTWYLKRADCELGDNVNDANRPCDEDGDDEITVEDWKIAAMGEIARNGFNNEDTSYDTDSDNDGYQARFGGSAQVNVPNHCYFQDKVSGEDFEIADAPEGEYTCPDGRDPVCVVTDQVVESGQIPESVAGTNSEENVFEAGPGTACYTSGGPMCSSDGTVSCSVGTPACIDRDVQNDCGTALTVCETSTLASVNPICRHLFPDAPGHESGDGTFGLNEELFWRTNPADDSTAENGSKDEANVVGLGRTDFTWNYLAGDKVGVVVEGTSTFPTKHDDSSFAIMWAFSNNDCPISEAQGTGTYTKNVKNYQVTFPTVNIDLNDCLERNLIDPTQGGQATNLELQMVTSPENPVNDETTDKGGDVLTVQTIVNNGQDGATGQLFEWTVEIANNPQFNNTGTLRVANITEALMNAGLLSQAKGTGLDTIDISLNMSRDLQLAGRSLLEYLNGEQGYLRISSRVSENFASDIMRKGSTNVIVPFTSTRNKIIAYKATPTLVGEKMRVVLPGNEGIICQDARIDRAICRVVQNEIIGMKIDAAGLSNFQWSINDSPLQCLSSNVSTSCGASTQNEVNFFPVSGGVGSSYTVTVTANDIQSGKTVTLSRLFQVVDPTAAIVSADPAQIIPKFLGQYRDLQGEVNGCPEGYCSNYSKSVFQGYTGGLLKLKALLIPSFLSNSSQLEWEVNGKIVSPATPNEISIDATDAIPGEIGNVTLRGVTIQDDNTRRALADTWGISQLDSSERRFEQSIQIEMVAREAEGELAGVQRYFAALGTYVPETFLYTLRMLLSGGLVLFVAAAAFIFIPEYPSGPERVRRREE